MNQDNNFTLENFENLKNGDKYSFDLLYKEYNLILYRTALLLLGNKDDAEDVLQDTFLSIYKNINSLKDFNKLKPWIFSILKNFCYTKYKKRKREFPDEFVLDRADIGSVSNGEDEFLLNEEIEEALLKLKQREREVIVLFYYDDFSIEEIAKICKTFKGTVKSRLFRARNNLKKELIKIDQDFCENFGEKENIYE
ncbi:RNA polymerase sigma factor [Peptoniphilus sp. AGMB00490]|uniref:RNA polymerase sigma factor n=1 Tax=Peptoniphilus faecalis TaxID=2731255 RepID=A0A848RGA0_9FIRM|nr:RNA polymerase sigma factor [Peptoniphilus faecalis]NMW84469.1 RNA polymerase sigma factor [Peptoniphilus faecalis]